MNLFTRRQKRTQVIPQRALNHTEFMRLYKEGYNDIQMSEYFGITIIKAIRFRDSLDLSPNFNKMQIPKIVKGTKKSLVRYGIEMSAFNALYNTGADDNDLSEIFQITKCAVRSIRHEFKYKMNQKRVLTTAERYKLLFDSGLSVDEICTIHNISQDTVRGWAHKLGYKKAYSEQYISPNTYNNELAVLFLLAISWNHIRMVILIWSRQLYPDILMYL